MTTEPPYRTVHGALRSAYANASKDVLTLSSVWRMSGRGSGGGGELTAYERCGLAAQVLRHVDDLPVVEQAYVHATYLPRIGLYAGMLETVAAILTAEVERELEVAAQVAKTLVRIHLKLETGGRRKVQFVTRGSNADALQLLQNGNACLWVIRDSGKDRLQESMWRAGIIG